MLLKGTADSLQMIYPGYLLNPGDMFSVDPERVLFATGLRKRAKLTGKANKAATEGEEETEAQEEETSEDAEAKATEAEVAAEVESASKELDIAATPEEAKKALRSLMDRAKLITTAAKGDLSGRHLKEMRKLSRDVRKAMTKFGTRKGNDMPVAETVEELTSVLTEIVSKIPAENLPASEAPKKPSEGEGSTTSSNPQAQDPEKEDKFRVAKDAQLLQQALQRARENPKDESKPYATPWRPRNYMSAFAFIPRYLEVNHNVCSAVYLRHPVARPGLAEVPSPIHPETAGLAFNWYLRRR
jgi:ribosomal protein S4